MERCLLYVRRTLNNIITRYWRNNNPAPMHQRPTSENVSCNEIVYNCAKTGLIMIVVLYMLLVIGLVSEIIQSKGKNHTGLYVFIGAITVVFLVVSICLIWLLWSKGKKRTDLSNIRSENPDLGVSYDAYQRVVNWLNNVEAAN